MAKSNKGTRGWKLLLVILLGSIIVMVGMQVHDWWLERKARFVRYDAFGTDIPTNYSIHGIDVSKYQDIIDWNSVKSMDVENIKIGFAFIKATEGNGNSDRHFNRNWKKAKEAGVVRGAYHFFLASKSGRTQAENFIETVSLEKGDLPPVIDVEQTYGVGKIRLRERVKEFLLIIENHYGVRPVIYTNVDFYTQYLDEGFDEYPLWVAHYLQKDRPRIYRPWQFWQHSETGRVNGIFSKVDFNVFNGDSSDFQNMLIP
ncbi:MAG: glycoside hydrolase family 25 protein [Chitinophagaceae bacterium]